MSISNSDIPAILHNYKHIAVVGLSEKAHRASYSVSAYMQSQGYDIIPVNPRYAGQTILGKKVYGSLSEAKEAGEPIEIVNVFRRSEDVPPVANEAIEVGGKVLWLQLGISNDMSAAKAEAAGLKVVQDKCIKVEHSMIR